MRSFLLIAVLTFALTGMAVAPTPPLATPAPIAPWVLAHTADGATTGFIVVLRAQADTGGAAALAAKAQKGRYVFDRLARTARDTQGPLRAFLDARGVPYRAYWIVNAIAVERGDRALALALAARDDVAFVEGNPRVREALPAPFGDADTAEPAAPGAPQAVEPGIADTHAPQVWALGYTGQTIVVAGEDTGYRWTHSALKDHYRGWDGTSADHNYNWWDAIHSGGGTCGANSPQPCDDNGHGTHTIGTLAGDDGGVNQIGMAPGARWIGCRNLDQGWGTPVTFLECQQFMLAPTDLNGQNPDPLKAPHVIVNSWSCSVAEGCPAGSNILLASIQNLVDAGIVYVARAGGGGPNCSTIIDPPAIYAEPWVFTIGAYNAADHTLAGFSAHGPVTVDGSNRRKPDLAAPGVNVRSAVASGDTAYAYYSGESMAVPHVAGAVALLLSARPQLIGQVAQIQTILENTANPNIAVSGGPTECGGIAYTTIPNNHFGYGRVDALAAVNSVPPAVTPTATATASPVPSATPTATATASPAPSSTPTATPAAYQVFLPAITDGR
jgi:serine protease AprX